MIFFLQTSCAGAVQPLASVEDDKPGNRFNDAKCDQMGRLWCGTMGVSIKTTLKQQLGCLYSFDGGRQYN